MNEKTDSPDFRVDFLTMVTVLIFTSLTVALILGITNKIVELNHDEAINRVAQQFLNPELVKPEAKERILFYILIAGSMISLIWYFPIADKIIKIASTKNAFVSILFPFVLSLTLIGGLILFIKTFDSSNIFGFDKHDLQSLKSKDFYYGGTFVMDYFFTYIFIIFPVILTCFFIKSGLLTAINRYSAIMAGFGCMLLCLVSMAISIFSSTA